MMRVHLISFLFILVRFGNVQAAPLYSCPLYLFRAVYMADDTDPCIFWVCRLGVNNPGRCPEGLGTLPNFVGRSNPCIRPEGRCVTTTPAPTTPTTTTSLPPETQPPTPNPTSAQVNYIEFPGYHILGGKRIAAMSAEMCFEKCRVDMSCWGVDWDSVRKSCYTHGADTGCQGLIRKDACTHRRYNDCPAETTTTTTTTTPTTTSTTTTTTPTTTTTMSTTTTLMTSSTSTGSVIVTVFEGVHIIGATRLTGVFVSDSDCVSACINDTTCIAVDYDTTDLSCWVHTIDTACLPTEAKPACRNLRVRECPTTSAGPTTPSTSSAPITTAAPIPTAVEVLTGQCPTGGIALLEPTTLADCLRACDNLTDCVAVNYITGQASPCEILSMSTACVENIPANAICDHYRLSACSNLAATAALPLALSADICVTPFFAAGPGDVYPGPDNIHECTIFCNAMADCHSIDWDFLTNTCTGFNETTTCTPPFAFDSGFMHVLVNLTNGMCDPLGCIRGSGDQFLLLLEQNMALTIQQSQSDPTQIQPLIDEMRVLFQNPVLQDLILTDAVVLDLYQKVFASNALDIFSAAGVAGTQLILTTLQNIISSA